MDPQTAAPPHDRSHNHQIHSQNQNKNQVNVKTSSNCGGQVKQHQVTATTTSSTSNTTSLPPPIVYGELSILGYNGSIPSVDKNGRRNRSKFLLCRRSEPNGIRKSRHYIVKQPQDTKAILDKECHSISYTFSRSQAIIVEYVQDETTDMFQIGRSSENPIDFVVMDTLTTNVDMNLNNAQHSSGKHRAHANLNENDLHSHQHQQMLNMHIHRHLVKVGDEMHFNRNQQQAHQAVLLSYTQPNISSLPPLFHHNYPHRDPHSSGVNLQQTHQHQVARPANGSNNNNDQPFAVNQCKQHGSHSVQSTISRFACRILVDRKPPHTARIYAAGFDSSKNIFLGEKATKWEQNDTIDGLTTNGVLLMHPRHVESSQGDKETSHDISDTPESKTSDGGGVWREVSVDGGIYAIRESRSAAQKGTRIESESNILQDGTLIDLCGATLLWRSIEGFKASPTKKSLEEKIDMLNASRPQCPVGLNTLVIPRKPILPNNQHHRSGHHKSSDNPNNQTHKDYSDRNGHQPYVYLKCGHVQGYHNWGTTEKSNHRTCPICLTVGPVAKLSMGLEPSFYVDSGLLTHVFSPCGHMASEKTVRYWCSVKIPHGTHFFHSICPFCASPLATNEPAATRLIFQDDLD